MYNTEENETRLKSEQIDFITIRSVIKDLAAGDVDVSDYVVQIVDAVLSEIKKYKSLVVFSDRKDCDDKLIPVNSVVQSIIDTLQAVLDAEGMAWTSAHLDFQVNLV